MISGRFAGVRRFLRDQRLSDHELIHQEIRGGAFQRRRFYERRARRLAPALLFVLWPLFPSRSCGCCRRNLNEFGKSLYAANLFAANFLFWDQTNYFTPAHRSHAAASHLVPCGRGAVFTSSFPYFCFRCAAFRRRAGLSKVIVAADGSELRRDPAFRGASIRRQTSISCPGRFWELGLGAAVALSGVSNREFSRSIRECFAWAGLSSSLQAISR
ncbi:hypothetical protein F2981_16205 [Sinorhizobium meliloti]|nr:hypothetical protein [Sinorhizobium meliloti]